LERYDLTYSLLSPCNTSLGRLRWAIPPILRRGTPSYRRAGERTTRVDSDAARGLRFPDYAELDPKTGLPRPNDTVAVNVPPGAPQMLESTFRVKRLQEMLRKYLQSLVVLTPGWTTVVTFFDRFNRPIPCDPGPSRVCRWRPCGDAPG